MTTIRRLPLQTASPSLIREFGEIIGVGPEAAALPTDFYNGTVRLYAPATFSSDEHTQVTLASIDRRPMSVRWMERHFKHTQTFIPLGGKPFVAVLSPPSDSDMPDMDRVGAFLFDGTSGLVMRVGTWHEFPFSLVDDTHIVVILRHETTRNLMRDAVIDGEAHGPDLDKKDLVRRTGVQFHVEL